MNHVMLGCVNSDGNAEYKKERRERGGMKILNVSSSDT